MTSTAQIEDALTAAVTSIAADWPRMETAGIASGGGSVKSTDAVTALDRWVSLRYDVVIILKGWCRVIVKDRPVTQVIPLDHDVPGMCAFLIRHAQWFSGHEDAPDAVDELSDRAKQVRQVARPTQRDWMPIGTCPLEVEFDPARGVETCGGQVRAWPSGITDPTIIEQRTERQPTCQRCGTEADVRWWYAHMFPDGDTSSLVTIDELIGVIAVRLAHVVTHERIRQWRRRGKITIAGRDQRGRGLYDHAQVISAIEDDIYRQRIRGMADARA